jgi:hypothetical protein
MDLSGLITISVKWLNDEPITVAKAIQLAGFLSAQVNKVKNLSSSEKELICRAVEGVVEQKVTDEAEKKVLLDTLKMILPHTLDLAVDAAKGQLDLKVKEWASALKKLDVKDVKKAWTWCCSSVISVAVSQNVISSSVAKTAMDMVEKVEALNHEEVKVAIESAAAGVGMKDAVVAAEKSLSDQVQETLESVSVSMVTLSEQISSEGESSEKESSEKPASQVVETSSVTVIAEESGPSIEPVPAPPTTPVPSESQ